MILLAGLLHSGNNANRESPMNKEAPQVEATCHFQVTPEGRLQGTVTLRNVGETDVLVFDRLWTVDRDNQPVADPQRVYRFERDGELRLLFGGAPLPRLFLVTFANVPYATRIRAGTAHEIELSFPLPVTEYSCYFDEAASSTCARVVARRVRVIVTCLVVRSGVQFAPVAADPTAFKVGPAEIVARASSAVATCPCPGITVLRRTDMFDRVTLPGETPEPLPEK